VGASSTGGKDRQEAHSGRRSATPGGFEVGAQVGAKLSGFALHLSNQLPLLVGRPSCPFQIVAEPTNALQPLREFGAFIDNSLVTHEGSIAPPL
jgi:hypothetical protein